MLMKTNKNAFKFPHFYPRNVYISLATVSMASQGLVSAWWSEKVYIELNWAAAFCPTAKIDSTFVTRSLSGPHLTKCLRHGCLQWIISILFALCCKCSPILSHNAEHVHFNEPANNFIVAGRNAVLRWPKTFYTFCYWLVAKLIKSLP